MTTQTDLTPSQAAFNFFNDLFLDPVLLAAYSEKCWSLNGAKNADEILTGWLGKLGYPGATPGLVYQVLQFWQSQSLWLWQGEYNQSFYYPPNGAVQTNQYSLRVLSDENGELGVTLNGEVLTYSLAVDQNYLTLSWNSSGANSAEGSVTFYYSPACLISESSAIQYAGNFFNGFLGGNPFKGALLTQTDQQPDSSPSPWYHIFWTDAAKIVESVTLGVLIVGGYGVIAKKKGYWPFNNPIKPQRFKNILDDEETLPGDTSIERAMDLGLDDIQLKNELQNLMDAEDADSFYRTLFFKTQDLATQLNLNTLDLSSQYFNLMKVINNELDLGSLDSTALRRTYAIINNETSLLRSKYRELKRQAQPAFKKEKNLEPENLPEAPPQKLANELVENQEAAENFQADPNNPLNVDATKTVQGFDEELKVEAGADEKLAPEEIFDKVEAEVLEDAGG